MSMLWSELCCFWGIDGQANNDWEKDVVPGQRFFKLKFCSIKIEIMSGPFYHERVYVPALTNK